MSLEFTILNFLTIPAIFVLGLVSSWQDHRTGKVKNKLLIPFFYYGLAVMAGFFVVSELLSGFGIEAVYFGEAFLNFLVSVLLAFALWYSGVLAAADAKLYMVYALLVPTYFYSGTFFSLYPALALFLNVFTLVFVYVFLKSVFYYAANLPRVYRIITRKRISGFLKDIFKTLALYFPLFILLYAFRAKLGFANEYFFGLVLLSLLAARKIFTLVLRKIPSWRLLLVLWAPLLFYYDHFSRDMAPIIVRYVLFMLFLGLFFRYFAVYSSHVGYRRIPLDKLRPGMLFSASFVQELKAGFGSELKHGKNMFKRYNSFIGMDEKRVGELKEWGRRRGIKEAEVVERMPFAVWIFLGVLLTLYLRAAILVIILGYF